MTGAIARTATNFRSGARTSGLGHHARADAAGHHPGAWRRWRSLFHSRRWRPCFSWSAYNMGEWREIGSIVHLELAEKSVWLITFVLTVVADLTVAVEVGMSLAALFYIYRVSQTTTVSKVTPEYIERGRVHVLQDKQVPPYVTILRIHGPFLFGTTDKLFEETADLSWVRPDRDSAAAKYDSHRWDRRTRTGELVRPLAPERAYLAALWRPPAAGRVPAESGLHRAHWPGEHSAAHTGGAAEGRAGPSSLRRRRSGNGADDGRVVTLKERGLSWKRTAEVHSK